MAALESALLDFKEHIDVFAACADADLVQLRRNIDLRTATGCANYRHLLKEFAGSLERDSLILDDAEQRVYNLSSAERSAAASCAAYESMQRSIQDLETYLAQYGFQTNHAFRAPPAVEWVTPDSQAAVIPSPAPNLPVHSTPDPALRASRDTSLETAFESLHLRAGGATQPAGYGSHAAHSQSPMQGTPLHGLQPPRSSTSPAPPSQATPNLSACFQQPLPPMHQILHQRLSHLRDSTPSSVASPQLLSPSMRELLGRYGASSGGRPSTGSLSSGVGLAGLSPPTLAYETPDLETRPRLPAPQNGQQLGCGALEGQLPQLALSHASEAARTEALCTPLAARQEQGPIAAIPGTRPGVPDTPAATPCPSSAFLEQYRSRFPAMVASTETLVSSLALGEGHHPARAAEHQGSPSLGRALVSEEEYMSLPSFLRGQLPLDLLNSQLDSLFQFLQSADADHFGLEDLTLVESRAKTFMNALFKLEKAQLRVFAGLGTRYVLL